MALPSGIILRGTRAGQPAATAVAAGTIYGVTDEDNILERSTGAAWEAYTPVPAIRLIEEKTPSGVGTITFSSLGAFTHLEIRYSARSTQVATLSSLNMQFNGDTGANYDTQVCTTVNTTVSAGEGVGLTFIGGGNISGASAQAGACGAGTIRIYDYRGTTFYKAATADMVEKTADASGGLRQTSNTGQWRNTAAITSVTLVLGSGNYVAGSKFSLFGLR